MLESLESEGMDVKELLKKILRKTPAYWEQISTRNMLNTRIANLEKKQEMMFWWSMNQPGESMRETKLRVYRNMPKVEGKIRQHQLDYLGILEKAAAIFEANGLTYWPMGGTMIGAVRHNGFIPWDDDLDISMMSEDKEKLFDIFSNLDEFIIEEVYWSDNLLLRCPRIRYADEGKNGCIDIFLWERADNEANGDLVLWEKRQKYARMKETAFKELKPSLRHSFFKGEAIQDPQDKKRVEQLFEEIYAKQRQEIQKSGNTIYGQIDMWFEAGRWKGVYRLDDMLPMKKVKFETMELPVPKNYDEFLTMQYGDWLSLPGMVSPKHTQF